MVRLENVLKISLQDVLKTSSKRLEDALKKSWRRFEDIWPRLIYWSWLKRLEDVFWRRKAKANIFVLIKTFWRRLLKTKTNDVLKTSSSRRMFAGNTLVSRYLINPLLESWKSLIHKERTLWFIYSFKFIFFHTTC